eukprot:332842-Prorocentrum_minimum.AAC.4
MKVRVRLYQGGVAKHLNKLGFPLVYNKNEDFYAKLDAGEVRGWGYLQGVTRGVTRGVYMGDSQGAQRGEQLNQSNSAIQ